MSELAPRTGDAPAARPIPRPAGRVSDWPAGDALPFLADLIDITPGCIFRADIRAGVLRFISDNAEEVTGYPGHRYAETPDFWLAIIRAGDRERVAAAVDGAMAAGERTLDLRYVLMQPDGGEKCGRSRWLFGYGADGEAACITGYTVDVTHEAEMEEALRQSEQHFRDLVESGTEQVTLLDPETLLIRYESPAITGLLGYSPRETCGSCFLDFVHPNDALAVEETCRAAQGLAGVLRVEYRFRHRDGRWKVMEGNLQSHAGPLGDSIIVTARDVTHRREAEEELLDLSTALMNAAEGISRVNHDGRYVQANTAYAAMFGTVPEALLGREWMEGVRPEDQEALMNAYQNMWTDGKAEVEVRAVRPDRSASVLRITLVGAFDAHGALSGHHCFAKDVTEFKRMEGRLRQAERLEGIGHLAAGVAHEINTPIQYVGDNLRFLDDGFRGLLGLIDAQRSALRALDDGEAEARVREAEHEADLEYVRDEVPRAVSQALQGVESVATIVRAMKQFSHPGAAVRSLVDVNAAITSTLTVARNEWKYVATVRTELDPALPCVLGLQAEINQALLNVVLNAAQAVEEVVGRDSDARGTITVTTRGEPGWVEIRVADTGNGIPEPVRERIWDPFFTTKPVGKGTGQGLALVHSMVVDHHGGSVRFETETGVGTVFILRLPTGGPAAQGVAA